MNARSRRTGTSIRPGSRSRCGGFSLLEALLAVAVLAFGLGSYAVLMKGVIDAERVAQRRTVATALALDKLEVLRDMPPAAIADGTDPPLNSSGQPDQPDSIYTRSWTVVDDTPTAGTRTLSISCSWPDKDGTKTVQLASVLLS